MNGPILVVLAAGMGSRYGALKQTDRIGRGGEVLLHYSVYDALRSGFTRVVFVIRRAIEADFTEVVLKRFSPDVKYSLAYQELDTLIPGELLAEARAAGREQPWGTTHALLCAAAQIDAPFLVINADDFYGKEAFTEMGRFLSAPNVPHGAIVTYELGKTLSPRGAVSRGVCEVKNGFVAGVQEYYKVEKKGNIVFDTAPGGAKKQLAPSAPVSMNFWGFPPSVLPLIAEFFTGYLGQLVKTRRHECNLVLPADALVKRGAFKIQALKMTSGWFGITWREDRQDAIARIMDMTRTGVYPSPLW